MNFVKFLNINKDINSVDRILEISNFKKVKNKKPIKFENIIFIIPNFKAGLAGGITSILRIGTFLESKGKEVFYACYKNESIKELKNKAKKCLDNYQGKFITFDESLNKEFDICVATSWQSVYFCKLLKGYKLYFVQDYEPYFHEIGDKYALAKLSYEMGFHIISLGKWNVDRIKENIKKIDSKLDFIDFPYEEKEYTNALKDYSSYKYKKEVKMAVYIKPNGRRLPKLIQGILSEAKKELILRNINLKISYFGMNNNEKLLNGENLGVLNTKQLNDLYEKSDFGLVASMTNVSLVPFEMISKGLPVIDFEEGSLSTFVGENGALFIDYDYKTLCNKLINSLNNPKKIEKTVLRAKEKIKKVTWGKSCQQFYEILNSQIEKG